MIDPALRLQAGIKTVERAVFRKPDGCAGVGVLEYARSGEDVVYLICLVNVEIAGKNHRFVMGDLGNLFQHKTCSLAASHFAYMVHVQVEEIEFIGRQAVPESAPCTDPDAGGIPTQAWHVGCLVEPEVPLVQQLQTVLFVEDGGIFTPFLAIVTSHADVVVSIEPFHQVAELGMKHFLGAEYSRCHEVHLVANHLAAL